MGKPTDQLEWVDAFLTAMIQESLPPERCHIVDDRLLAHVIWMAFGGFVINQRIGDVRNVGPIADMMIDLLPGPRQAA